MMRVAFKCRGVAILSVMNELEYFSKEKKSKNVAQFPSFPSLTVCKQIGKYHSCLFSFQIRDKSWELTHFCKIA